MYINNRNKISKGTEDLNSTVNPVDLIEIYKNCLQTQKIHISRNSRNYFELNKLKCNISNMWNVYKRVLRGKFLG
jgi:hypothetical protein